MFGSASVELIPTAIERWNNSIIYLNYSHERSAGRIAIIE